MQTEKMPDQRETDSMPPVVDVFPDFAISLEEANRRVKMLQSYVREHMVEGEDYGVIAGTTKPTLFKPGAEKLNAIFGLAPIVEINNRVEDWDKGFVAYEVKVTLLNKRNNAVEAEGIGSCNSRERRYKNQDAANIANTILKMSKKRALIDATLSATRASGLFTQDLEDIEIDATERTPVFTPASQPAVAASPQTPVPSVQSVQFQGQDGGGTLTDAQHRAILAIASRVFGRAAEKVDFESLAGKPVEELTKSEASALIDRLRGMQSGQLNQRESASSRSSQPSIRNGVVQR